jgi:hypothetical protein
VQGDRNPLIPTMLVVGFAGVAVLHLVAGWRERVGDRSGALIREGWVLVGPPLSIPDKGARITAASMRSTVCVHQKLQV